MIPNRLKVLDTALIMAQWPIALLWLLAQLPWYFMLAKRFSTQAYEIMFSTVGSIVKHPPNKDHNIMFTTLAYR